MTRVCGMWGVVGTMTVVVVSCVAVRIAVSCDQVDDGAPLVEDGFVAWKPYGIDIREPWDDDGLLSQLQRIPNPNTSGFEDYYGVSALTPTSVWRVSELCYCRKMRRIWCLDVSRCNMPTNDVAARKLFKAYEREIDLQLKDEPRWNNDCNDSWSGIEHRIWRIARNDSVVFFRLDLYLHTVGNYALQYSVSDIAAYNEMRQLDSR